MRLGTCVPGDENAQINGQFSIEKALSALSNVGIRGCLYNFVSDESRWEEASRELSVSLKNTGVALMEYNAPLLVQPLERSGCSPIAHKFVKLLSIAESIGCLNVVACTGGFGNGIGPHPRNRSQKSWDLLKETCLLIAEEAEQKKLRARVMLELVYTSAIWSPSVLTRFVDEINSPNVQGHMDIANCLTWDNIYDHADFIRESFCVLGSRIHSAHIKDVAPIESYFPGLEERGVGDGVMDFRCYLTCLSQMPPDFPALIEHMYAYEAIQRSYRYISSIADEMGISVWSDENVAT
jgi:sugar phosphate isomerase/epimerase